MALLMKAGIVGGLATSVVLPVTITSSTGAKSVGLLDLDSLDATERQTPPKNTHEILSRAGYRKKKEGELVDFNEKRETRYGGNFALGCNKLLFRSSYVPKLADRDIEASVWGVAPMKDHLGKDKNESVLGCSTAAIMKGESGDVYEFELAVRRGDKGFLERITVQKNKTAVSQLIFYKKVPYLSDKNNYSWFKWHGIQRKLTKAAEFEIGNPEEGKWTELSLEKGPQNKPNFFTVWIENSKEERSEKPEQTMLENLGIKTKTDKKLFSSIAKADTKDDWHFNVFATGFNLDYYPSISTYADNSKRYATYTSKIAEEVEGLKGTWKDVKNFCKSQENKEKEILSHSETERLRDYCYIKQTN